MMKTIREGFKKIEKNCLCIFRSFRANHPLNLLIENSFFFQTFPQQWLMSHSSGVNGIAVASIQPMGTGALMWTINKDICNRNTLQPFDALMTVCTVSF